MSDRRFTILLLRWLFALAVLPAAPAAQAACVLPLCSCSVTSTGVAFGNYNPLLNTAIDSSGNVRVACTGVGVVIPYTVALSTGTSGSYTLRTMRLGGYSLNYNLYTDSNRTQVWNSTTASNPGGTITLNLAGIGAADNIPVYGRLMNSQQTAVPGLNYTDTVTMTITYY